MSGPMQWSKDLNRLVPAIGNPDYSGATPAQYGEDEFEESLRIAKPHFQAAPEPPSAPSKKPAKALTTTNVLTLAKARLKDVKKELRRMKALEKERAELERLIAAAQTKPQATVVALKTARS